MGAVDLLRDLMAEGVEFETDGKRIRWSNGGARLTPERLAVLRDGKTEVLQFLSAVPDTDGFEERAAIAEFDGGLTRSEAERLAARSQGFDNVVAFKAAQAKVKEQDWVMTRNYFQKTATTHPMEIRMKSSERSEDRNRSYELVHLCEDVSKCMLIEKSNVGAQVWFTMHLAPMSIRAAQMMLRDILENGEELFQKLREPELYYTRVVDILGILNSKKSPEEKARKIAMMQLHADYPPIEMPRNLDDEFPF